MLYVGLGCALLLLAFWLLWGNLSIGTTRLEVEAPGLPAALDGLCIVQVSDLHNACFGKDNVRLLRALADCAPDIIAVTGDMVDSRHSDVESAMAFMEKAVEIAPVFYVTGNHEARLGSAYTQMETRMRSMGVQVLRDEAILWEREGAHIWIAGLDDPAFSPAAYAHGNGEKDAVSKALAIFGEYTDASGKEAAVSGSLASLGEADNFTVLLTHRPEYFMLYAQSGMDLVLAGHAHGGQIRLPILGGLFAPGQGFFPLYDAGLYTTYTEEGKTVMYVSRGLGNSAFPLRIHNRPELVLLRLKAAHE